MRTYLGITTQLHVSENSMELFTILLMGLHPASQPQMRKPRSMSLGPGKSTATVSLESFGLQEYYNSGRPMKTNCF